MFANTLSFFRFESNISNFSLFSLISWLILSPIHDKTSNALPLAFFTLQSL